MPDITPPPLRSRANGILNIMGGLGALIAFFGLSGLYRRSRVLPFDLAAAFLIVALVAILLTIRERRLSLLYGEQNPAPASNGIEVGHILPAIRSVVRNPDRTVLFLILGALAWVAAVNGVQNMFTRYGIHHLGLDPSGATFLLGFFALTFIVSSVPAGIVGDRIGRLRAIRLGLAGTLAVFMALTYVHNPIGYRAILAVGGACWALAVVNAYPFLIDQVPPHQSGMYTGLYNAAIGLAGLLSPPIYGLVVDAFGFGAFFLPGILFMAIGFLFALRIRGR